LGLDLAELLNVRAKSAEQATGATLGDYAALKRLNVARLQERFGLADTVYDGKAAIEMPLFNIDGSFFDSAQKVYRVSLVGKDNFRSPGTPQLYDLPAIAEAQAQGELFLTEGPSDVHTFDLHGIPAVGIPGAGNWNSAWARLFEGIEHLYAVQEPDEPGAKLRTALAESTFRDRLSFVQFRPHKDPSELHLASPDHAAFMESLAAVKSRAEPAVWRAPTAAEFMAFDERKGQALFRGLPRHGIAVFSGQPRSLKSMTALQMSFAIASGGTFLGRECYAPGEVLYVIEDEDQRADLVERMEHFERAYPGASKRIRVLYHHGTLLTSPESIRRLRDTLDAMTDPVLLVLDTWSRVRDGNENDAEATGLNLRPVHALLREYGLLVVIVHHDAKHSDGRAGDRLRGSGALYAASNAVWSFTVDVVDRIAQHTGRLTIEPKSGQTEVVRYRWDIGTFLVDVDDAGAAPVTPELLATEAERLDPHRRGLTSESLHSAFPGVKDTAWKAKLAKAVKQGALISHGKARATRYLWPEAELHSLAAEF
jgi:hypothetical protein